MHPQSKRDNMSDFLRFSINYNTLYNNDAASRAVDCLMESIRENWVNYRQSWSFDRIYNSPDPKTWLTLTVPDRMLRVDDECSQQGDEEELVSDDLEISFSPASSWVGYFSVSKSWNKNLGVSFRVDSDMRLIDYQFFDKIEPELAWSYNRSSIANIYQKMLNIFPVNYSYINDYLFR